ncbi:hypothetical protein [Haladaptatus cibarius]|uniref:hypothetical protein n=1 Tax=Haladaptatus cibarius TaxID=453847 RepID=UPI000678F579|nr:hypothetical protein [Haladaptatus cibarius]
MDENTTKYGIGIGLALWVIAIAIQGIYNGIIGIINPFLWLLSSLEAIEFFVWLLSGGSIQLFLDNLASSEAGLVLAGIVGLLAWVVTFFSAFSHSRETGNPKRYALIQIIYNPFVAIIGSAYYLRKI